MSGFRTEKDSLGSRYIPAEAYYGINTLRGMENFPISGLRAHPKLIDAFLTVKKSAALANKALGLLEKNKAEAIAKACDEIAKGKLRDQFVVDVFQMGAGTALHMNVNEVLANRANEILKGEKGQYSLVHPNDQVNLGQSTNDVFPTAMRIAGRLYLEELYPELEKLFGILFAKGKEFDDVLKSARTHLQDAVPIRLGQEFRAYGHSVKKSLGRLKQAAVELEELGIGGSAAGTGINTHPTFPGKVISIINKETGIQFRPAEDLREAMQSQRAIAEVSGALKNLSLELIRIANDLRLLSSGPTTGLNEILLPAVQAGSSIMPGKVNPSMAEMLNMVCFQVVGCDLAIAMAVQAGQLELNVMMPLMAHNLLFSMEILKNGINVFTEKCVRGISANRRQCQKYAERSVGLATALTPLIGYAKVAEIVKEAVAENKSIIETIKEKRVISADKMKKLLDLKRLTEPGIINKD